MNKIFFLIMTSMLYVPFSSFGMEWSKVAFSEEPKFNEEAMQHYAALCDELAANGLPIEIVALRNGEHVTRESINKVARVINELKADNTFENRLNDGYPIPPRILTEGLHVIGQQCKNGCEMNLDQFRKLMHENFYVQLNYTSGRHRHVIDQDKKDITDAKIGYLFNKLCAMGIIQNNQVYKGDAAVIDASIKAGLDQHIFGTSSRGFAYVDPMTGRFVDHQSKKLK